MALEVDPDDLDPAHDRLALRASAIPRLVAQLAQLARQRKSARAVAKGARVRIVGLSPTFKSAAAGARELVRENPQIFEASAFDGADLADAVRETLVTQQTRRGGKLANTAAGKAAFAARSNTAAVEHVLAALLALAPGKRWRAVPWPAIASFVADVVAAVNARADQGWGDGTDGSFQLPLESGQLSPGEVAARLELLSPEQARRFAEVETAAALDDLADRYAARAKDSRGEDAKMYQARARDLRRWARRPSLLPETTCDPDHDGCVFGAIRADLRDGTRRSTSHDAWEIEPIDPLEIPF